MVAGLGVPIFRVITVNFLICTVIHLKSSVLMGYEYKLLLKYCQNLLYSSLPYDIAVIQWIVMCYKTCLTTRNKI